MSNILNFKSFLNFLGRNKAYTAIDLFGLSVSLMFVILIASYVVGELSTDRYHEKAERIYELSNGRDIGSAFEIGYRLEERYPEIEKVCHVFCNIFDHLPIQNGDQTLTVNLMLADTTFFDFFNFPLVKGNWEQALAAKNYAVISESFANKYFGNEDPIGKTIRVKEDLTLVVNGVMKDIRHSVIPDKDILARVDNLKAVGYDMFDNYNSAGAVNVFVMERAGADISSRSEEIKDWFKTFFWIYERELSTVVEFIPLKKLYFWEPEEQLGSVTIEKGDYKFVVILLSVGLLILLFAIINYINLTVAQTGFRAKEMATRRLLGSSRKELFARLIMESTMLTTISFLLGLLLAFFFAPFASDLLQKKIDITEMVTPLNGLIVILLITLTGFVAGLLPAIVISNAKPIEVVRGTFRKQTKMVFSKFFIIFQNVITICLVAASITMFLQIRYLVNAPLGYNSTNIIDIYGGELPDRKTGYTLVNELEQLACVNRVGLSEGTPFSMGMNFTGVYDGKNISSQEFRGDKTFFDMLGFEILRDNQVAGTVRYYLSEEFMKVLELPEDARSYKQRNWEEVPLAGIVKDFQLNNILTAKRPTVVMICSNRDDVRLRSITVEVKGDPFVARKEVAAVYEKLTGLEFSGMFINEQVEKSFTAQKRTLKIVMIFAVIAVLISLLGLLAMSTYFIQQRSSEIAVRKVFGSTNAQVLIRLVKAFLMYVAIAFVIAVPLVWYFMNGWLADYSYRIELSPWIYATAGLLCLIISFITVLVQSYQAAISNPVEDIRDN